MSALSIDLHDQVAEEAALAAALQNVAACDYVVKHLHEDDFWSPDKRAVFMIMATLRADGKPVDAITVKSEIRADTNGDDAKRRCDLVGHLTDTLVIATNAPAYVDAILAATVPPDLMPLIHEAAHAEVLASAWRGEYRWAHQEGTWRRWTGSVWQAEPEPVVLAAAQKVLRRHYGMMLAEKQTGEEDKRLHTLHGEACRNSSVLGGLAFLKGEPGFYTAHEQWDADLDKLNCADGLLDLETQTLHRHDPAALCTMITRWKFADEGSTGAWERQLELGLPNPDIRRQVQRDLGRALSGATKEHSLPIWYGIGRNTKTTDAEALLCGLDGYAHMAVGNLLMATKYERHPTEIAELSGKRLVFSDEIDDGKELAEARVKDLTGGGAVKRAHFMRQDNFNVKKTFSIFLLVNHLPTIKGTDKGIWDRIREVPWTVSIPFAKQRKQDDVVAELVADGSWMLRWLVAGYADFQANPRWIAAEVQAATAAYHGEQDRILGFITDACEEKPFVQQPKAELYDAYVSWCTANDVQALGKTDFAKALKNRGIKLKRTGHDNVSVWLGIRLFAGKTEEVRQFATAPPVTLSQEGPREEELERLSQFVAEDVGDDLDDDDPSIPF
jgi:putative DNA primase/helicase